jgi:radical SAM superfamily enzyme YgiQ (UPF0313 family)
LYKINSSQFNYTYRNRIHLPYSISLLVSYIKTKEELSSKFKFEKTFVFRDEKKIDAYIEECKDSDILLCSCYVWNWEITTHLARKVKEINPECLIIFGGPQAPQILENFFEKYPFVDIIVHGEGELILENLLAEYLNKKDYTKVKGISTKEFTTLPQDRIANFEGMPSPYLTNTVWDLVDKVDGIQWIVSWETNRGCPYACTFCDWGSATATTMRKWSDERLYKEIEWFADNKIPYIDCCDANFGIYRDRDLKISKKLTEQKSKKGFPETFRTNWAKVSSEKIIPLAKELQSVDLLNAVTLSLQSLDANTLKIIKRANLKFDTFSSLTTSFKDAGIPTYTELIMGLPGETLDTFKKGLETALGDEDLGAILLYNCGLLPNAPMNYPDYREKYKLKAIRSPVFLQHSPKDERGIQEYENILIETSSYTLEDLKKMYRLSWVIQTFHSFGILEYIAKYYQKTYEITLMKFYESILEYGQTNQTFFSNECNLLEKHIEEGYSGKGWAHYDINLGNISWPFEEASVARFLKLDTNILYKEINKFVEFFENKIGVNSKTNVLSDLIKFQIFLLTTRDHLEEMKNEKFMFDWKNYFTNQTELKYMIKEYTYKNQITEKDPVKWTWEVVWFGHKEIKYKYHPKFLQESVIIKNRN